MAFLFGHAISDSVIQDLLSGILIAIKAHAVAYADGFLKFIFQLRVRGNELLPIIFQFLVAGQSPHHEPVIFKLKEV